jgi:dihydropteroate synthase
MGILNVTPDSFSDGGEHQALQRAITHGMEMAQAGADIIDVGGESVRPGAKRIRAEEQKRRVVEVTRVLRMQLSPSVLISIETTLSEVAVAALDAGAAMINDVSAGCEDPKMFALAAARGVPIVLMHMRGIPDAVSGKPHYHDVVAEVEAFLRERALAARHAGIQDHCIILDPGIGFGKGRVHNLLLLARLERFVRLGYPVLLGTSRKRFMGSLIDIEEPRKLLPATCATTALGVMAGVSIFRVHDVAENRQVADVTWAIKKQGEEGGLKS